MRNNFFHSITLKASHLDFQGVGVADASTTVDLSGLPHKEAGILYKAIQKLVNEATILIKELDTAEKIKELENELSKLKDEQK